MNFKNNETIYSQIAEYVKKKIFSGEYACGARLPAIRDFAQICQVNPNTIVRVYLQLSEEGLIYTDSTNGKYVTLDAAFVKKKREEFLEGKTERLVMEVKEAGMAEKEFLDLAGRIYRGEKGGGGGKI